jgi:hypothetical protein
MVPPGGLSNPEVANVGTVSNVIVGVASSTTQIDGIVLPLGITGLNYNFGITVPQE